MQIAMLSPPGPAPPAANAPGLALGHQLSTPGSRPAGPPGQGAIFAEAIAEALAAAQGGAMQIGNAGQPEPSHGASLLARLLLGSTSGETEPEGDATETAGDTTQPDRLAEVGMASIGLADGLAAAAIVAVDTGADVGAVTPQQTPVTAPQQTAVTAPVTAPQQTAVTAPATTVVTATEEFVVAAPVVADAGAVIARQVAAPVAAAVPIEQPALAEQAALVTTRSAFGEVADGEPAAPMAGTPVVAPGGDEPAEDADGAERLTYEAPGKSVTRGKAGDAPRSARAAMVSAVTGEPGRAAAAQHLDRGAVARPAEAPAPVAAQATAAEVQPLAVQPAPLAVQQTEATVSVVEPDGPRVASRIAETVQSAVMRGDSEVRLVLNPPRLGRVDIRIVDTPDGLVVAIEASKSEARELISRSLVSLQAALEGRELRVDRLTVDQPSQQSQDEPGRQGQRGEDGRQQGRDEENNGNGFGGSDGEAHDASSGTQPGRRVDAPAGVRHDGVLNLVA